MGLWDIITGTVSPNIGMGAENILLIIVIIGSLIFMARSVSIGLIILFFMSGGLFMLTYNYGLNYAPYVAIFFISLVLLVFTVYTSHKSAESGAII